MKDDIYFSFFLLKDSPLEDSGKWLETQVLPLGSRLLRLAVSVETNDQAELLTANFHKFVYQGYAHWSFFSLTTVFFPLPESFASFKICQHTTCSLGSRESPLHIP
jgi:hypothetical protein